MVFDDKTCALCRKDFPALARTHNGYPLAYLDGPGGTQVPQKVIDAVSWYYKTCNSNTHGMFITTNESDAAIQETREAVAAFLGAPDWSCISFGHNMTTLNFSLSHALVREMAPGDEIVITELDHEANRGPWLHLVERGIVVKEVKLLPTGRLDYADMAAKVTPKTRLVAIGFSSNALGTINDIAEARRLSKAVGARLLVDAVHYAPHFPLDVAALDVDFLLCSAYKFYAPHIGILYCRPGLLDSLTPDRLRTQDNIAPFKIETGTMNHAAIVGVKAGIEYIASWGEGPDLRSRVVSGMTAIAAYEHGLASEYYEKVKAIPGVTVWGTDFSSTHRAPTVSITIDGVHPAEAAKALGEKGLLVWDGDFYAVRAIEVLGLAPSGGVIRVGFSMYNTREEIARLLEEIRRLAKG
jgi:cysteine desulfurase family protein (TIGR01976 family)